MTRASLLLIAALLTAPVSQSATHLEKETPAIVQVLLDYAEGYFGGEPVRMARAVSPYLSKRQLVLPRGAPSILLEMNAGTLIDASNGVKLPPDARRITTEVMDAGAETASARVFTARFHDYVQLIKRNGAWEILNVLWHAPPAAAAPQGDPAAVEQAVRTYAAALSAGDAAGALSLLLPVAHIRVLAPSPQGRPRVVLDQNAEALGALLARGQRMLPAMIDELNVTVEGVDVDIAAARFSLGSTKMYLQMALHEGRWRVVSTLSYAAPAPR